MADKTAMLSYASKLNMTPVPVWQVNMEVIIVLIITLISILSTFSRVKLSSAPNLLAKISPTFTACPCPVYDKASCAAFDDNAEHSVVARQSGRNEFVREDWKSIWHRFKETFLWLLLPVKSKGVSSDPKWIKSDKNFHKH